ncbi:hypothetical protein BCEP27_110182 [Burkholderia cepacia]
MIGRRRTFFNPEDFSGHRRKTVSGGESTDGEAAAIAPTEKRHEGAFFFCAADPFRSWSRAS